MEVAQTPVERYLSAVHTYDGEFKKWTSRAERIIKRYRDEGRTESQNRSARFNILWSNVQTLTPAVYAKMPKADVSRRFTDNDPVGRVAALLIERSLNYEIEHYPDFRSAMRNSVEDRFLGGRGTAWVRYDPHIKTQDTPEDGLEVTEDIEGGEPQEMARPEEIEYECAPTDYVHWRDYGHTVARTWEEVPTVWRWVYMDREALVERFGEKVAKTVPLNSSPKQLDPNTAIAKANDKAKVCELWDKDTKKVVWISEGCAEPLDERDDPLELEGFFPCPRPLYATTTSDSLVPVPDFVLYQDQAKELDILSDRIDGLIKALKVRGVYNASVPALARLLTEGDNNTLIPVENWTVLSERGGLAGAVDILPIDMIAKALIDAYQAHEQVKGQIHEITGLSDIIRGQSVASETATAQQIKGQYAGLRLRSMQEGVALYATALLQLKAQIICTKYQPQTIMAYAAVSQMTQEDQALVPQALELIRNSPLRSFRVEVAADSLIQLDETQEKQDRVEFITGLAALLKEAIPAGQASPELIPMLMAAIKFSVAGFKAGREIEGTIDTALQQLTEKAAQAAAQPPPPDPEMAKVQAQVQADQARAQADTQAKAAQLQADQQAEAARMQADMQKAQLEAAQKEKDAVRTDAFNRWKVDQETSRAIMVARIAANPGADVAVLQTEEAAAQRITEELGGHFEQARQSVTQMHDNIAQMHGDLMNQMAATQAAATAPKRVIRGADGRVSGIETVPHGTMQ